MRIKRVITPLNGPVNADVLMLIVSDAPKVFRAVAAVLAVTFPRGVHPAEVRDKTPPVVAVDPILAMMVAVLAVEVSAVVTTADIPR